MIVEIVSHQVQLQSSYLEILVLPCVFSSVQLAVMPFAVRTSALQYKLTGLWACCKRYLEQICRWDSGACVIVLLDREVSLLAEVLTVRMQGSMSTDPLQKSQRKASDNNKAEAMKILSAWHDMKTRCYAHCRCRGCSRALLVRESVCMSSAHRPQRHTAVWLQLRMRDTVLTLQFSTQEELVAIQSNIVRPADRSKHEDGRGIDQISYFRPQNRVARGWSKFKFAHVSCYPSHQQSRW